MKSNEEEVESYIMMEFGTWIYGTIFQCERLLSLQSEEPKPNRKKSIVEEEFVVVCARKMIRWLGEARKQDLVSRTAFSDISNLQSVIVDVRNMREHSDDYVVRKKGRKQDKFYHHAMTETGLTLSSDATSTIVLPGRYLIGGRLSVQLLLEAARSARVEFNLIVSAPPKLRWLTIE